MHSQTKLHQLIDKKCLKSPINDDRHSKHTSVEKVQGQKSQTENLAYGIWREYEIYNNFNTYNV